MLALQPDAEIQVGLQVLELPTRAKGLRRLGRDAVEGLALEVQLVAGVIDVTVEPLDAPKGVGMGDLEVHVAPVLALELGQLLLGLGQLGGDALAFRSSQALEGLPEPATPSTRDGFWIGQGAVDEAGQLGWLPPVELRSQGDDHVAAGEHLPHGQGAVVPEGVDGQLALLLRRSARGKEGTRRPRGRRRR